MGNKSLFPVVAVPLAFFGTFFRFERKYFPPRGGSPTAKDRVIATRMGYEAVRVLAEGGTNRVIVIHSDQVTDLDIDEGLAMMKTLNQEEFQVMKTMTGQ